MCGRYQFTLEQCEEIRRIAQAIDRKYGNGAWAPGEIRPTALAPVLIASDSGVHPELQTWGYKFPGRPIINARAETAEEKPTFRNSVQSRRCVVPSTGFYEWDKEKRKYFFSLPDEDALYMAGLYDWRDGKFCYCVLTTAANESMREIHPRMPLVLTREQIIPWLEESEKAKTILRSNPPLLKKAAADAQIRLW